MANQSVPGFLASLTLDGLDITADVRSTPLARTKTMLQKKTMNNSPDPTMIPGPHAGTLSVSGFVSQEEWNAIEVTWAKEIPVAFTLVVTEGLATDSQWAAFVVLDTIDVEPNESGLWEFSLSGEIDGAVTYTPSAAV